MLTPMLVVIFLLFHHLSSATAVVTAAHAAFVAPVSPAMAATLQKTKVQAISKHTQVLICYFMITLHGRNMKVLGFKASQCL
jgi:hypothetical protein